MKKFVIVFGLLLSAVTWASNPMIRNCRLAGGEFFVVSTTNDELPLCRFENSYVGAIDVMNYLIKVSSPESLLHFISGLKACLGEKIVARELNKQVEVVLCQFEDGSIIDISTLNTGIESPYNQKLTNFLQGK